MNGPARLGKRPMRRKLVITVAIILAIAFLAGIHIVSRKPDPVQNSTPHLQAIAPDTGVVTAQQSYSYRIVNVYPHDPQAFTQGLVFADGILYEGTGGAGVSTLRKVKLETGEVMQLRRLRGHYFGEGVAVYKDKVIQITYMDRTGFVCRKDNLEVLERFSYPTEGWGLTSDGVHLVMSDGTANLYFLDPQTFARVRQIEVKDQEGPLPMLNELEYVRGFIYANIWQTDDIAIISPKTGQVAGYIHLQGILDMESVEQPIDVLNGIAYDAEKDRLFVTGKLWPVLFEIQIVPEG